MKNAPRDNLQENTCMYVSARAIAMREQCIPQRQCRRVRAPNTKRPCSGLNTSARQHISTSEVRLRAPSRMVATSPLLLRSGAEMNSALVLRGNRPILGS